MSLHNIREENRWIKTYTSGMRARATYEHSHWEIHQGKSYTVNIADETMGAGDTIALALQTSGAGEIHMFADFGTIAAGHLTVYENADWSGGQTGTQISVYNRNRQSSNTPNVFTQWRASGVMENSGNVQGGMSGVNGTAIAQEYGWGSKFGGNLNRGQHELILKTGTMYAFEVEADAGSNGASLVLNWYEES